MDELRIEAVAKYMHDSITETDWDEREDDIRELYRARARSLISVADAVDPLRSVNHRLTASPAAR